MSEQLSNSAGRLDNWNETKTAHEKQQWEDSLYGEAGKTDFSEEARTRVEEADAYEQHMALLGSNPDGEPMDADRLDAIDRTIDGDPALRRMADKAREIAALAAYQPGESDDGNRLMDNLKEQEDKLEELLLSYQENGAAHQAEKDEIFNRIINMSRDSERETSEQAQASVAIDAETAADSAAGEPVDNSDNLDTSSADNQSNRYYDGPIDKINSLNNKFELKNFVDEPVEASSEENEDNPVDTSLGNEADNSVDTSLESDADQPADTSFESDADKPVDTSLAEEVDKPVDTSLETDTDTDKPVDTSLSDETKKRSPGFRSRLKSWFSRNQHPANQDRPVDTSLETDTDTDKPVDTSLESDADKPVDTSLESDADQPVDTSLEADEPTDTDLKDKTEKSADKDKPRRRRFGRAALAALLVAGAAGTGIVYEANNDDKQTTQESDNGSDKAPDSSEQDKITTPDNSVTSTEINREAITIDSGEGWNQTMLEMGIPSSQWANILNEVGPKLGEMSFDGQPELKVAYFDEQNNEWRINEPTSGEMPQSALELITNASSK